ncbi:MAG: Dabb family protein [Verrucomicrobiota bacterium]
MKIILLTITLVAALSLCGIAAETSAKSGKLQHVVILKFKAGTNAEEIRKVETAFRDLKKKIPQIAALEWGTNVSPEKHDKGYTHCFVVTFKSDKDRDAYLPHPEHKNFGKVLIPVLEDVLVIDFWAQE